MVNKRIEYIYWTLSLTISVISIVSAHPHYPLDECLIGSKRLKPDQVITPLSDPKKYQELRFSRNLIRNVYPLLIVLPNSTHEVSIAMKCAYISGVRVCPRSGRHSYEVKSKICK